MQLNEARIVLIGGIVLVWNCSAFAPKLHSIRIMIRSYAHFEYVSMHNNSFSMAWKHNRFVQVLSDTVICYKRKCSMNPIPILDFFNSDRIISTDSFFFDRKNRCRKCIPTCYILALRLFGRRKTLSYCVKLRVAGTPGVVVAYAGHSYGPDSKYNLTSVDIHSISIFVCLI